MQEDRINKALELHKQGFNCAQSVFVAYSDLYNLDKDIALRLSTSFGGGIGGMRHVCGAVAGMAMIAGLETGTYTPHDKEGKKQNYDVVKFLAGEFEKEHGSIICKQLLGLEECPTVTKKKPCDEYIRYCAQLIEEKLLNKEII